MRTVLFQLKNRLSYVQEYISETFLRPLWRRFPQPEQPNPYSVQLLINSLYRGVYRGLLARRFYVKSAPKNQLFQRRIGDEPVTLCLASTEDTTLETCPTEERTIFRAELNVIIKKDLDTSPSELHYTYSGRRLLQMDDHPKWEWQSIIKQQLVVFALWNDLLEELKPRGIIDVGYMCFVFTVKASSKAWVLEFLSQPRLLFTTWKFDSDINQYVTTEKRFYDPPRGGDARLCYRVLTGSVNQGDPSTSQELSAAEWYKGIRDLIDTIPHYPSIGPAQRPREILFDE